MADIRAFTDDMDKLLNKVLSSIGGKLAPDAEGLFSPGAELSLADMMRVLSKEGISTIDDDDATANMSKCEVPKLVDP